MEWLKELVRYYMDNHRKLARWKRFITAMAAIVVFLTTYALILPAITVEKESSTPDKGIYLEDSKEESHEQEKEEKKKEEDSASKDKSAQEEKVKEDSGKETTAEEKKTVSSDKKEENKKEEDKKDKKEDDKKDSEKADSDKNNSDASDKKPKAEEKKSGDDKKDSEDGKKADKETDTNKEDKSAAGTLEVKEEEYKVLLSYKEGASIPEGAKLIVKELKEGTDEYKAYLKKVRNNLQEEKKNRKLGEVRVRFFDITIKDGDKEFWPDEKVNVEIETDPVKVEKPDKVKVVWFDEDDKDKENTVKDIETETEETNKDVKSVSFDANEASVYGIIYSADYCYRSFSGDNYKVILNYDENANIPANTELDVKEIKESSDKYKDYIAKTEKKIGENEKVKYARFFDIKLSADGKEIQPDADVDVKVKLEEKVKGEFNALELGEKAEIIDAELINDKSEVDFTDDGLSVYGIVGTTIEKNVLASDGQNYKISVTYKEDAGVPEGAGLEVKEILQKEEATDEATEYETYIEKTKEALGIESGVFKYVRFFDIKIVDENRKKVEITAPVDVQIELADKENHKGETTQVIHFADGSETGDVMDIKDIGQASIAEDGTMISFETSGFSVYAIVDAPEPATIEEKTVKTLTELSENTGETFYLSYGSPQKYFTNKLNGNSCFIENSNINSASEWFFEPADDGNNSHYYLCTNDDNGKKYVQNTSGNLVGLTTSETDGTVFELTEAEDGTFYFKHATQEKWLQHSGGGGGIRFWGDNNNATNSMITITYVSSLSLEKDPYKLDGKTYGIAYHDDSVTSAALTSEGMQTSNNQQRLTGQDMLMKPDVLDNDGILLVAENSDIEEWTFESIKEDLYHITVTIGGQKKYLTINGGNVTLENEPDETYSVIQAIPGTGTYSGKWHFTVNRYSLNLPGNASGGFNASRNSDAKTWMNLVEKSVLNDDSFTKYTAKKVSVSDTEQVYDGQQVIIYTRIWNDTKKKYEFFAVDHDGSLIPCYDVGDNIEWIGTDVNTALWNFKEGHNTDGSLSYYYYLQNYQYKNYIVPQVTKDQILYDSPITDDSEDFNASVNLNGRRYGSNYTTIIAWDDDKYAYSGLKAENGRIVPCALSDADDFYFAIVEEAIQPADPVTEVATVDSNAYGITMKMVDFNNAVVSERDSKQMAFMGSETGKGLLSTDLGEDGYPTATSLAGQAGQGKSLGELYSSAFADGDPQEVNHLFLQSIYNESGYFEYDSTQNFAHLNSNGNFTVYNQIGAITGNSEHKNTREHGQFMPYNDISPEKGYAIDTQGKIITNQTDVLANELPDTNTRKGEPLYLIGNNLISKTDTTGDGVDYYFGMEMEASFTQTASGLDAWGHDIIFEFSGDDDFWLYVDGELVLDLGGVHSAQVGTVNFRTGVITSSNGNSTLYETFKSNYEARGLDEEEINKKLNGDPNDPENYPGIFTKNDDGQYVFKNYTNHTMRMFYMERGAGASNLHMRFNLAAIKPGTFLLSKNLSGMDGLGNNLLEFPYQIWYLSKDDSAWHLLGEEAEEKNLVLYEGTTTPVKYSESFTPSEGTTSYSHVYFLKHGETAEVTLPEKAIKYYVKECGINPNVYNEVKINGEVAEGVPTGNMVGETARCDYPTSEDTLENRNKVDYDNHVKEGTMRTLSFTKRLYDSNGTDRLHYPNDSTLFSFRLYLGLEGTEEDKIPTANLYPYLIKDSEGYYCRREGKQFVPIIWNGNKINDYSILDEYLETLTGAQKEEIIFRTSPNGSISQIPADFTVEVRDLVVGTLWKVEERDYEIPKGYTLRLDDGYTRIINNNEEKHGTTPISDTIKEEEDPKIEVRNQKGWGLTIEKVWTDKDFMVMHDPIYFAVYVKGDNDTYTLVDNSVRQLETTEDSIYYFFDNLQSNIPFEKYVVYEVTLEGGDIQVDAGGKVSGYTSVTKIEEGGTLTIGGQPVGGTYHPEDADDQGYTYTVAYQQGEQTSQNENVRTDIVTNSRPGIKMYKTKWDWNSPLADTVFTLDDSEGNDVAAQTYTSRGSDGLITIAYLNDGTYTLTETATPKGYVALDHPITITVQDSIITVSGEDTSLYQYTPAGETLPTTDAVADMATIFVRNRPMELEVFKVDAITKDPLQGANFALYRQVTNAAGDKVKDYQPISGYENLVTTEVGKIEEICLNNLTWGNTYYLTETQPPEGYEKLKDDLCFTIGKDGHITINSSGHENWLSSSSDESTGKVTYHINIPNGRLKKVSFMKVDIAYPNIALPGAKFDLYQVKVENGQDVRIEPALYTGLVSDDNDGLLKDNTGKKVFELPAGKYHLVETDVPDGYIPKAEAVEITITADTDEESKDFGQGGTLRGIIYVEGTSLSESGDGIKYDANTKVYTLKISNTSGIALPNTGGPGTLLYTLGGFILMFASALMFGFRLRRRERRLN